VKTRLHKPKRGLWNVALLLFILGVVGAFAGIPILSQLAFYLILVSAALMLLGTWVIYWLSSGWPGASRRAQMGPPLQQKEPLRCRGSFPLSTLLHESIITYDAT
jgi:uncharacterized membrane protein YfcA